MRKLLSLMAALLCGMCAFATTTTELWNAIGRPIGVSVSSVDKWVVTSTPSAKSDIAGLDNTEAAFALQMSGEGVLTFQYQVSSEANYDKLIVKVDGSAQKEFSGNEAGTCSITISTSGSHTVNISYKKDSSGAKGEDMAVVKNLSFGSTLTIAASVESISNGQYADKGYSVVVFEEGSKLKHVGDRAFKNCANLTSIEFPEGLVDIGDGAFDGCSALTNIVFPSTMTSLGTIDVSGMTALKEALGEGYWILSDWVIGYDGECPPEIVDADRVRGFAKAALKDNIYLEVFAPSTSVLQGIPASAFQNCFALEYMELPASLKAIGDSAFQGCTWLQWIDIPGSCETIGDYAFRYCYSLEGVTFASGVTSIGERAFYDDYLITEVDLPASVERIGDNAFGGDSSLIRIGLRDYVKTPGTYSHELALRGICSNYAHIREVTIKPGANEMKGDFFQDCKELTAIRFLSMTAPTLNDKGASLLLNTPGELTVYVPNGSTGWVGIAGARGLPQAWPKNDTCTVRRSIAYWNVPTYLVEFDANGGSLGVQPTYQKPETAFKLPPEPKQSGYAFAGWWTSPVEGWQVTAETIFIEGVYTTLYAHWTRPHTIFLDANGGTVVKPSIQIEQSVYGVLPTPTRTGYAFDGWSYLGETVVPHMSVVTNADHTLSAQWKAFNYSVHFNPNGGSGTMAAQEFKYDTLQSLAKCMYTRSGYCFVGWATTANGTVAYVDAKMVKNLSALQGGVVNLYAVWVPGYTVTLRQNAGAGGTTSVLAAKGYDMPKIEVPHKGKSVFGGYWTTCGAGGVQYYTATGTSAKKYDRTSGLTLWAKWTNIITFGKNGGTGGDAKVTAVQGQMPHDVTVPSRAGYRFSGYWTTVGPGGIEYFDASGKAVRKWDRTVDTTLWAKWTVEPPYVVTLNRNGGTGGPASASATFGMAMPKITAPTKAGSTFAGYWTSCGPTGVQYYMPDGSSARTYDKHATLTLWAKWTNKLTFGKNGGVGGDEFVTAIQGQKLHAITPPTRNGYAFDGYWTTTGAGGVQYFSADGVALRSWDRTSNITLWAKWVAGTAYKVTLGLNGGEGGSFVYAVKGAAMPRIAVPTRAGYTFGGYWTTTGSGGVQYYKADGTSARNWDKTSAASLWAKWTKVSSCVTSKAPPSQEFAEKGNDMEQPVFEAGYWHGVFVGGAGVFDLLLDEDGTVYLSALTEDGGFWTATGEAEVVGEALIIMLEDGLLRIVAQDGGLVAQML